MAIFYKEAWFAKYCSENNHPSLGKVDFQRTITLGRQSFKLTKKEIDKLFTKCFTVDFTNQQKEAFLKDLSRATARNYPKNKYSEPFFKIAGGGDVLVDSLDCSDYEEATVIHDLSIPIPKELKNKYTCVYDGGLLEHVYNYPVALKNAMDMVSIGGHLILITPANNYFGHGFYQFSPELFYSILRKANGFQGTQVYLCNRDKWYLVKDPRTIKHRTEVSPRWPNVLLFVVSKKIGEVPDNVTAFQSDYEELWKSKKLVINKKNNHASTLGKIIYRNLLPSSVREAIEIIVKKSKINYKKRFKSVFTNVELGHARK